MLLLILAVGYAGSLFAAQELDPGFFSENENSAYRFTEHLATDAEVVLTKPKVYSKNGVWAEDRFFFPGTGSDTDLVLNQETLDGKPVEMMQFQSYAVLSRTLQFFQVPPSAHLVFYVRVTRSDKQPAKNSNTVYLRLFVGKHLITRLRLSSDDGWVHKSFLLQSVRFLKQNLRVTLDVVGDDDAFVVSLFGYAMN